MGLSTPSLVSYPEVRQLLAEVADPRVIGSVLSDAAASMRTNMHSEILRSAVDVQGLQVSCTLLIILVLVLLRRRLQCWHAALFLYAQDVTQQGRQKNLPATVLQSLAFSWCLLTRSCVCLTHSLGPSLPRRSC